jgi:predicted transcriptional regulator
MASNYLSLDDLYKKRKVNKRAILKKRDSILAESRALRLADFRKALELTQVELAEILGVDQSNISRIERGKLNNTEVGTLQAYIEALGGSLEIRAKVGNKSLKLIDG